MSLKADLPVLRGRPTCPAAMAISGACESQRGVICREMQADQEGDAGVDMSAGQLGVLREGEGGVYINVKGDPSTVTGFCHGDGLPVLTDEDGQGRASYTYCPTWQAARDRHLAGKDGLYDELEPEPVSMGVEVEEIVDPWAAARRDMAILAPDSPAELEAQRAWMNR